MLEVFVDGESDSNVIAYLDGRDARLFRAIQNKLGSEERTQNALILLGLLKKLTELGTMESLEDFEATKSLFPEFVGTRFDDFEEMIQSCSSIV